MKKSILISIALAVFLVPAVGFAASSIPYWGPLLSCGAGLAPCTNFCDMISTTQNIINFAITVALFIIAAVLVLYGGFMLLIAGSSSERFTTGKKILTGTVIGIAIVIGSFLIINTFLWAMGLLTNSGDLTGEAQNKIGWPIVTCNIPAIK